MIENNLAVPFGTEVLGAPVVVEPTRRGGDARGRAGLFRPAVALASEAAKQG
jgi:hypothetical protein